MKREVIFTAAVAVLTLGSQVSAQTPPLPAPKFHHLQLNSVDPDAAIAFYMKEFPSTSKTTWEGMPALSSPDNVLIVFNKVARPPIANTQCYGLLAFWLECTGLARRHGNVPRPKYFGTFLYR